jgi:hypothetical protein
VWPLHPDQPERPGCSSTVQWGATLQTRLGRVFASFAVRGSSRNLGGFPGAGAWVPVEAAEQLSQHLKLLHAWSKAHEPLDPVLRFLIRFELSEIEYLLDLEAVVAAQRWQAVAQWMHLLLQRLASLQETTKLDLRRRGWSFLLKGG